MGQHRGVKFVQVVARSRKDGEVVDKIDKDGEPEKRWAVRWRDPFSRKVVQRDCISPEAMGHREGEGATDRPRPR